MHEFRVWRVLSNNLKQWGAQPPEELKLGYNKWAIWQVTRENKYTNMKWSQKISNNKSKLEGNNDLYLNNN